MKKTLITPIVLIATFLINQKAYGSNYYIDLRTELKPKHYTIILSVYKKQLAASIWADVNSQGLYQNSDNAYGLYKPDSKEFGVIPSKACDEIVKNNNYNHLYIYLDSIDYVNTKQVYDKWAASSHRKKEAFNFINELMGTLKIQFPWIGGCKKNNTLKRIEAIENEIYSRDAKYNGLKYKDSLSIKSNYNETDSNLINYIGKAKDGLPNGYGYGHYKRGNEFYIGQFVEGQREGEGIVMNSDSLFYNGGFKMNKREGKGKLTMGNGNFYEGEFKNDLPQGKGKYVLEGDFVYNGEFNAGKFEGYGQIIYSSGDQYIGGFLNNEFSSDGKYTWANGQTYEGKYANGLKQGLGVLTTPDKHVYNVVYDKDSLISNTKVLKKIFSNTDKPIEEEGILDINDTVKSIQVAVQTSNDLFSGTGDDIWIDIGPKAWRYTDGINRGQLKVFSFDPYNIQEGTNMVLEQVPLLLKDISQLRIEKKGIWGITNAPDNIAYLPLGNLPIKDPIRQTLSTMRQTAKALSTLLSEKQQILAKQDELIDLQKRTIEEAEKIIINIADRASKAPKVIADLQNKLVDLQKQILDIPMYALHRICAIVQDRKWQLLGLFTGMGWAVVGTHEVCHEEQWITEAWSKVNNTISDLTKQQNNLIASLQSDAIKKGAAIQSKVVATQILATAEVQRKILNADYFIAKELSDRANDELGKLEDYVNRVLPDLGNLLPNIGQWKIETATIYINNIKYKEFNVNATLKQGTPSWITSINSTSSEDLFVNGLRVNKADASGLGSELISALTTPLFKDQNISGWEPLNFDAEVTGTLYNPVSPGADAGISLDLLVENVSVNGRNYRLDSMHGILHNRYIRIEHLRIQPDGSEDSRYRNWHVGDRFVVNGKVLRDTDRMTFFEIHTASKDDIH